MRLSMPPFLPPYAVLFLVVAYAAGSLWLGLVRLDDITQQTESASRNAAIINDLQALLNAVSDIDVTGATPVPCDSFKIPGFPRGEASDAA